jgi:hypothetical protein
MSPGFLFADVGAFEWAFDQLDWWNFRYNFSQNGMMLHSVHFCRFFTKVPLSAMNGVPSKYVVDLSTRRPKDTPSHSASGWQNHRVIWLSVSKIHPWANLCSYAPRTPFAHIKIPNRLYYSQNFRGIERLFWRYRSIREPAFSRVYRNRWLIYQDPFSDIVPPHLWNFANNIAYSESWCGRKEGGA